MRTTLKKRHHVRLSTEERGQLETFVRKGKTSAQRQRHVRILLLAHTNEPSQSGVHHALSRVAPDLFKKAFRAISRDLRPSLAALSHDLE